MDGGWLSTINPIAILILAMININQYPCFHYIGDNIVHHCKKQLSNVIWYFHGKNCFYITSRFWATIQSIIQNQSQWFIQNSDITIIKHIITLFGVPVATCPPVLSWFIIITMNHHESPWYFSIIHQYIINHIPINPYCCCWLKHHFAEVTPYNLHKSHCFMIKSQLNPYTSR
jgi:hypothetical protein